MTLLTHGDRKYDSSTHLTEAAEWLGLRVEHRQIDTGRQNSVRPECTELVHILSGQAVVRRRADGALQEGHALPGTSWLVPAGTDEKLLELDGSTECLIIFLPPKLLEDSALIDHDIDPAKAGLIYEGGLIDPILGQIGMALRGLIGRPSRPVDRLVAEGLRTALAAHLVGNYNIDRWRPQSRQPVLEQRRLQRVLTYIDARLGESISLDDLAGEACLSPYHFARLFHQAMGRPPHRYVVERRIAVAQERLRQGRTSMVELALDTGFGTQANFSRVFRKLTGLTPRQYRDLQAN